jgi:hypothetical protein
MIVYDRPRSRQWVVAGALAAAVGAAILVFARFKGESHIAREAVSPRVPQSAATTSSSGPAQPVIANVAPAQVQIQPAGSGMAGSLRAAKDLRVFAMEAARRPEVGGITYAAYAADICRVAKNSVGFTMNDWSAPDLPYQAPEDPRVYAAKNQAYKSAKASCQGFTEQETAFESQLTAQAKTQGDVIDKAKATVKAALASGDIAQRKEALAMVLQSGDPLLLSETLERLVLQKTDQGLAYWVDGKQVSMNTPNIQAAFSVLPCKLGLICDDRTPEVLMTCINTGQCYSDRLEMVRAAIPESQRGEFDSVLANLESAVKSGRTDRFIP